MKWNHGRTAPTTVNGTARHHLTSPSDEPQVKSTISGTARHRLRSPSTEPHVTGTINGTARHHLTSPSTEPHVKSTISGTARHRLTSPSTEPYVTIYRHHQPHVAPHLSDDDILSSSFKERDEIGALLFFFCSGRTDS